MRRDAGPKKPFSKSGRQLGRASPFGKPEASAAAAAPSVSVAAAPAAGGSAAGKRYKVLRKTIIRETADMKSPNVGILTVGTYVDVLESMVRDVA